MRRKYKVLRNVRKPTGDPSCPHDVVRAKRINSMIESRMSVADLESDNNNESDTSSHPSDPTSRSEPSTPHAAICAAPAVHSATVFATPRTGLSPTELVALSSAAPATVLSQTAQRRRRIDEILTDSAENEAIKRRLIFEQRDARQAMFEAMVAMEAAREERERTEYNSRAAQESGWIPRDVDSMRRKYKVLRNVRKPTGDPSCPHDVVRAKRINSMIESRMSVADLESDNNNESDTSSHPSDPTSRSEPSTPHAAICAAPAVHSATVFATPRTGLSPTELVALSSAAPATVLSQTAQRRRRIDEILTDSAENEAIKRRLIFEQRDARQAMFEAMVAMEAAREERERVRTEERVQREEAIDAARQERQNKMDQVLLAILAKLVDK
ncbi:hypothetical protein H257_14068 [Aphanomyces astaci]|uniref:DUF6818 domain-containing protein n=1 Tax=Aphanomyces astaci TaxID=112090 RepID=W4FUQ2_APHAT|nr:hypothetical protein H257_14068 [Aphanomyces astaci]ETV70388.1 hypothetical protein H257_14068 [Aphanomyces astaci]|eukprot:XP_009840100.1 hypothetical protein H257_14068 [Aphanomyces astaci]